MATKKETQETGEQEFVTEIIDPNKTLEELVEFRAFKDNGRYKDDIVVSLNGKTWVIKRGETVKIPRKILNIIEQSMKQDEYTSRVIEENVTSSGNVFASI